MEKQMLKAFASSVEKRIRSNRTRLFLAASTAILAAIAFTLASVAANDAILPRSNKTGTPQSANAMPMSDEVHVLHGGLWRTDGGFVSTIRIKNVLAVAPIQVSPTIYMADGTAYPLAPVTVATSGVATVNINDALASAPRAIAPHVSEFGSLALVYKYPTPGHLVATLAAIDAPRSLSFVYMINEPMPMPEDNTLKVGPRRLVVEARQRSARHGQPEQHHGSAEGRNSPRYLKCG